MHLAGLLDDHPTALPRVLLADSDEDSRTRYRDAFQRCACDVVEAGDGREALVKALSFPPALLVTELRLAFIDGLALCEILRRDRTTTGVPIIVSTCETRAEYLRRAQRAGADVVLAKTASLNRLLAESRRLLLKLPGLHERAASVQDKAAAQVLKSAALLTISAERRGAKRSARHHRFETRTPPLTPPRLTCTACDRALVYLLSHVGGVNDRHPEQWDYFACAACGTFEFRHRTRRLRRVGADEEQWLKRIDTAR